MNQQRGIRILYTMFLIDLIVISWQEIKGSASPIGWPRPQRYVGLTIAFSLLAVLAELASSELAAVIGAGLSMGLVINVVQNQSGSSGQGTSNGNAPIPSGTGLTGSIPV
jgi:hypothetical protein